MYVSNKVSYASKKKNLYTYITYTYLIYSNISVHIRSHQLEVEVHSDVFTET